MPLFSIIVPVYNSEQFLAEAIQSVLRQNFNNLEIIMVNDRSTDKSGEICDSFCKQNACIKVIHTEKNSGVSASRNRALKAASGDYVLFLDSDDCLFDGCLSGLANLIEEKPDLDLIIGKYTSERYHLRGDDRLSQDFTFDNVTVHADNPDGVIAHVRDFARLAGVCWRFAINRNFLIKNNLFFIYARIYEDQEYVARLLCLARTFAFYNGCLYWYRARSGSITESITHSANYDNSAACLKVAGKLCKLIKDNNFSDLKKEFLYTRIKTSLITFCGHLPIHNCEEIDAFSKIIDSHIDDFKMLEEISHDVDMYRLIKTHGTYRGLLLFKDSIIEETVTLIENFKNKRFYVFCADLFGKVTAQMLRNEGCQVECFLDNNKGLEGDTILGLKVNTPSIFSNKSSSELADIVIMICHQRKDVFENIAGQLKKIGLKKEQLVHQLIKA